MPSAPVAAGTRRSFISSGRSALRLNSGHSPDRWKIPEAAVHSGGVDQHDGWKAERPLSVAQMVSAALRSGSACSQLCALVVAIEIAAGPFCGVARLPLGDARAARPSTFTVSGTLISLSRLKYAGRMQTSHHLFALSETILSTILTSVDPRWRDFVPAVVLMIAINFGVFAATLWPSGDQDQYAVMAPPSYNLGRTIVLVRAAGGGVVEVGGIKNIVIAHSANKNFVAALYRAGAWLVIDPQRLRGCIGFSKNPKSPGASS